MDLLDDQNRNLHANNRRQHARVKSYLLEMIFLSLICQGCASSAKIIAHPKDAQVSVSGIATKRV